MKGTKAMFRLCENSQFHPNMSAAEAARAWMRQNECTDAGGAAINYEDNGEMSVDYQATPRQLPATEVNGLRTA